MKKTVLIALILALTCLPAYAGTERKRNAEKPDYDAYKDQLDLRLSLIPEGKIEAGKPVRVMAKLVDMRSGLAIPPTQLAKVHYAPFHLLLVDPSLTDYQHVHPAPSDLPGVYYFTYTPKFNNGYRGFADVTPLATGNQQFVIADMERITGGGIDKTEKMESMVDGYRFSLTFDKPPSAKGESMGTITIATASGQPVTALEPVMGTYGHIVGFYEDLRTVIHTHPMDEEPRKASDRGGPAIRFHLIPEKPGFVRVFAQFRINGKDVYAPFGIMVAEEEKGLNFGMPELPDWEELKPKGIFW